MERKEFENVMEEYKFTPVGMVEYNYETRNAYYGENLLYYYGGTGYTVINGRVPLEVANNIYKKYPNNEYGIRVDGAAPDAVPSDFAEDDTLKKEVNEYGIQEAFKNFRNREDSEKYITVYHIDTKEGLKIFIDEMKKYLAEKYLSKAPVRVLKPNIWKPIKK